jgi:hypothetical protein
MELLIPGSLCSVQNTVHRDKVQPNPGGHVECAAANRAGFLEEVAFASNSRIVLAALERKQLEAGPVHSG